MKKKYAPLQDSVRGYIREISVAMFLQIQTDIYTCISYRHNIKHLYNIQIQKYIANKKIIQNYAQMKYKWPVTAIKPLKNKLFSVTNNSSTPPGNRVGPYYSSVMFFYSLYTDILCQSQ